MDVTSLPSLIREMLRPDFYPHPAADRVELRQTHISYVLLTGRYAYKVKKAVDFGFLDFRTVERRRHFCQEELRLNRRGAPGMYLDVLPITYEGGRCVLGGADEAVEYAVKIRQFPEEAMFSGLLARGELGEGDAEALATAVADYHAGAPTDDRIAAFGRPEQVRAIIEQNYAQTERFVGTLQTREQFDETRRWTDAFFTERSDLLLGRVREGRVRECHGDLHLGNVCREEGRILLFDCIEFNEAFRCVDTMYDVGFAAMSFRGKGRADLAAAFVNAYAERTGDWDGLRVLPLYLCRQAYVRAKVNSLTSVAESVEPAERGSAAEAARRYYRLAWEYTRPRRGRVVLMSGLSGSGKSTIARRLAARMGATHVRSDAVRKHLAGIGLHERGGAGVYTPEMTARTYARLLEIGLALAGQGETVILDAKYDRRSFRRTAIEQAAARGVPLSILWCALSTEVRRQRLVERSGDITDATVALFEKQEAEAEPFGQDEAACVRTLDATRPADELAAELAGELSQRPTPPT